MRFNILFVCALLASIVVQGEVVLPSIFSESMVLQRGEPINIWGKGDPDEKVTVRFAGEKGSAKVGSDSTWRITLPAMKEGGPYVLQVNDIKVEDILIGDVWLGSGQSNMELQINRVMDMFADEVAGYENEQIRYIKIPKEYEFQSPRDDIKSTPWSRLNKESVMEYSALTYFFARAMYEKTGVPIGIVNSSWGGSAVEAWMSEESLSEFPKYINEKRIFENEECVDALLEAERAAGALWHKQMLAADMGTPQRWYDENYDDSSWTSADMFDDGWAADGIGTHWFRKSFDIPADWQGEDVVLRLGCIVDADSVYVNGEFVGTTSYQYPPRIYTVPANLLKEGSNNITIRLFSYGSNPHFVKEKPYKLVCGEREISLEGEWRYKRGAEMRRGFSSTSVFSRPTVLYNAMIAPLRGLAFSGVIWYQGETNVGNRNEYAPLLRSMIEDWRVKFSDEDLPFYIVELADFLHPSDTYGRRSWQEMRQVQARVAESLDGVTLIKNGDIGEWNDIHPLDKKTPGVRCAEAVWSDMENE